MSNIKCKSLDKCDPRHLHGGHMSWLSRLHHDGQTGSGAQGDRKCTRETQTQTLPQARSHSTALYLTCSLSFKRYKHKCTLLIFTTGSRHLTTLFATKRNLLKGDITVIYHLRCSISPQRFLMWVKYLL